MEPRNQFVANLKKEREAKGLSQEKLAHESGLHWTQVSRVERGERDPKLSTVLALARGLGIPPKKLFDGIE